jgi:PAS domain S-box-containing protein
MADPYGLHVLLVEDNADERWLLGEILRGRGHTVTACEDGESGWKAFQKTRPPLLVLDWVLPGLDGLELCRLIREEYEAPGCVIMVVTSRDSAEDLRLVLDAGADDYVQKPLNVSLFEIRLAVAEQRVRNLRERERTRLALEAKSRELEALFENLDEVFFSVDVTLDDLIQVSPAARELLGILPEALVRDRTVWKDLLLPPGLKEGEDLAEEISRQRSLTSEYELQRPDGATRWVKSTLKPGRSSDGRIIRLDGILSDLTARKVVEEELSSRNQELQTLYRVSEITLTSSAPGEAFRQVLEEVRQATGFPVCFLERLDPTRDRLIITESVGLELPTDGPVEIPLHETLSGIAVERQKPLAVEDARVHARFRSDFLRRQNIRSYAAFPLLASGKVHGILTLADTEVREIPLRLLRWGESLANSLALFVERLEAESALREGEREALALAGELRAANEELEAFAYSVSHDLRAPLRTMQGFAHALVQEHGETLPPQARDFARRIIGSGAQAEGLIRDLLAYSRMSFEELELQEVNLGQAVADAREQVSGDLEEREARLSAPDQFPMVSAHHPTLVQVLANLLSNAVKFVPEDRRPEVVLRWEDGGGEDRIRIWVEDNGVGVPEEHRERIFKVFERLEGEMERPGTGIGLAIVRRGVQRIGGEVGVVPGKDGGSRFWVELPKSQPQRWRPWGGRRARND